MELQSDAGFTEVAIDKVTGISQTTPPNIDWSLFQPMLGDPVSSHLMNTTGIINSIIILSSAILAITQYFYSHYRNQFDDIKSKLKHDHILKRVDAVRDLALGLNEIDAALEKYDDLTNQRQKKPAPVHSVLFIVLVSAGVTLSMYSAGTIYCKQILPYLEISTLVLITGLVFVVGWAGFVIMRSARSLKQYEESCGEFLNQTMPLLDVHIKTKEIITNGIDSC